MLKIILLELIGFICFSQIVFAEKYESCKVLELIYSDKKMDTAVLSCSSYKKQWTNDNTNNGVTALNIPKECQNLKEISYSQKKLDDKNNQLLAIQGYSCSPVQTKISIHGVNEALSVFFMALKSDMIFTDVNIDQNSLISGSLTRRDANFYFSQKEPSPTSYFKDDMAYDKNSDSDETDCGILSKKLVILIESAQSQIDYINTAKQACESALIK